MKTQKDKIPADISQIPQEILKSYDRFRFCRYLFFGMLLTFLIYIVVFLTFVHDAPIMSFLCMLTLSAINILVCLNRLKYKKYVLLLFSDADKAFMLIWIHVAAIFYVLYALVGFYLQIKYHIDWDTRQIIPAIFIAILVVIITYNANPEFDADETVYLPAPKSQTKIGGAVADKISSEQNFNKTNGEAQATQDEAAKFEQKFNDASLETESIQSKEEALEYGKALARIAKNLKQKYQLHRLIRFAFVSFATTVFLILFLSDSYELHWAFIVSAVCTIIFFFSKRRYSKLFVENPEKSNTIFAIENFAIVTLVLYYPIMAIALWLAGGGSESNDIGLFFGLFYLLAVTPVSVITILVCLARNLSVYKEIKE